jgi:MEMO1 family protein
MKPISQRLLVFFLPALFVCLMPGWVRGERVRKPVCAGRFYPADAATLKNQMAALTREAAQTRIALPAAPLKALILPHAGYIYSGRTAAHAASVLKPGQFDKVILAGPDHVGAVATAAISEVDAYETPLGRISLHPDARTLRRGDGFSPVPPSDRREHSLEVILPFLQYFLADFKLIPVVIGPVQPGRYARDLAAVMDARTLLVVSSDLSHFLPYDEAREKDGRTIDAILQLDSDRLAKIPGSACGRYPILTLMEIARLYGWRPVLLKYENSGDTAGDRSRVVGYAAIAFFESSAADPPAPKLPRISDARGQTLVRLARATIAGKLGTHTTEKGRASLDRELTDKAFAARQGTFVTLKIDGRLRGCIGHLAPSETVADGVRRNAVNAAFHDPRFRPLTAGELDAVRIEVSLLTAPVPLAYTDAEDLVRRLRPGVDGVILGRGGRRATFLPQVWDQLPLPEDFLNRLCIKAGLAADAWRSGRLDVATYQVRYFEERH